MEPKEKQQFIEHLKSLTQFLKDRLKMKKLPKVILVNDKKNAQKILGKTAHYEPETNTIKLYITKRHSKDVLRSYSHEMIHAYQNENGKLKSANTLEDPQYAQNDPYLRKIEIQAYKWGNLLFRDWSDFKNNEKD